MVAQSSTAVEAPTPSACVPCEPAKSPIPTAALIFTQNTTRNPISWNAALRQPNPNEVLHSVHLALHKALDPCINGTGDACSWIVEPSPEVSPVQTKMNGLTNGHSASTPSSQTLYVPRPSDLKLISILPGATPEVSVKLRFYESHEGVDRCAQVDEALRWFENATGLSKIDRFVIGFDGIRWAGGDDECASWDQEVDFLVKSGVWQHISGNSSLRTIGVSDFSSHHLARLLSQLPPAGSSQSMRRPKIDQLNFDRELPERLAKLAKEEDIELQSHSDNRVPYQGIETLLTEFEKLLPLPPRYDELRKERKKAIDMHWVLKYTILLKDRGLVIDKGYILSLRFKP